MPSLLGSVGFCPSELAAVTYRISSKVLMFNSYKTTICLGQKPLSATEMEPLKTLMSSVAFNCQRSLRNVRESLGSTVSWDGTVKRRNCVQGLSKLLVV